MGAEGFTFDQRQHEITEAIAVFPVLPHDLLDLALLRVVGNTTRGVGHQLLGQAFREQVDVIDQPGFEFDRVLNLSSIGEGSRGVDPGRRSGPFGSPTPDRVEIFEDETHWVDALMAACARDGVGVSREHFAGRRGSQGIGSERRHVLRWLWWRCAEDVLEHPDAADDRLRIDPVGRGGKDGRLTKEAAVATPAFDFETLELTLVRSGKPLSLGLPRSETVIAHHKTDRRKREVGVDEVRHGKVLFQNFGEEGFGLVLGDIDTRFVEVELWVRHDAMQGIGIEPLSYEALDHGIGMLCRQEAFGFPSQNPVFRF